MKLYAIALGFMLMAGFAYGADIGGKWAGTMDVMGQQIEVNYTFKVDGDVLTGTTAGQGSQELEIKNGKIEDSKISFTVDVDLGGQVMTISYKGIMDGDRIKMSLDAGNGQPMEYVIKRVE
jgi:hypothetical protein